MQDPNPSSLRHVVGYGRLEGAACLRFAEGAPLVLRGRVTLKRTQRRMCVGWREMSSGQRHPCPAHAVPSGSQCLACSRREGFWACMTCDGHRCPPLPPATLDYCRQDHVLYLACFGGERVKVGTASWPRRVARLRNQGPLAAAHVAVGPGPTIKQMEASAVRMGLLEALHRSRKWQEFRMPTTGEQARARVLEAYRLVADGLAPQHAALLHEPRFLEWPRPPARMAGLSLVDWTEEAAVGDVVDARGHLVVLRDGAGPFAMDLGALRSWFVDLAPSDAHGPVRQLGLFG